MERCGVLQNLSSLSRRLSTVSLTRAESPGPTWRLAAMHLYLLASYLPAAVSRTTCTSVTRPSTHQSSNHRRVWLTLPGRL